VTTVRTPLRDESTAPSAGKDDVNFTGACETGDGYNTLFKGFTIIADAQNVSLLLLNTLQSLENIV
jgi:hypothetical protein